MSYHRRYKLKDNRFGLLALTLREKAGLTQAEVASVLGVSERTIGHWEGGTAYPTATNLKELIKLYLSQGAFSEENGRDEAKAFWEQAAESASRRKSLFDDAWFAGLLRQRHLPEHPQAQNNAYENEPAISPFSSVSPVQHVDWGEAVDVATFYGREQELQTLHSWVHSERCRVVILLGMGGIGKTTLSIRFAQEMTPHFGFVFWRSLHNAPPLQELLFDCIHALSEQQYTSPFDNVEKSITLLIELLRKHRCLLVLDNIETLLRAGSLEGGYRAGYEDYGTFIGRIAETAHQSCLLLTSREMPGELEPLEGTHSHVRRLKLPGLGQSESQELLKDKELSGKQVDWEHLVQQYSGNPLALKIASATVRDLFDGDIAAFVQEESVTLHTLQHLLGHQFERLTSLEQDLMYWLAVEREPTSLEMLSVDMSSATPRRELLSALMSLLRRCLIERGEQKATFTLQPVVMEYVSEQLVERMCEELLQNRLALFTSHAIMKAQSKEYIRDSQVRMLMRPLIANLLTHFDDEQRLEQHLYALAQSLREKSYATHKYSGGNLVNILRYLKGHLRNVDFSSLTIRQAYLQGIEAKDALFTGAEITETVFTEPIESMASMVLSPNGKYLAVGSFSGQIRLWDVTSSTSVATFKGHSRMTWTLAFSADNTLLASGGYDGSVKLWQVEGVESRQAYNESCLRTFQGHEKWIRSLAFSPDGRLLVTGGDDETVRVWDVQTGICLNVLHGHTAVIWSVAFSPDSRLVASGGDDETMRVWDVQTGICLNVLRGHTGMIMAVAFHPQGNLLASGAEDGLIHIWDVKSGNRLTTVRLLTSKAASIAFDVEGTILASGSFDGTVEVWRIMGEGSPYRLRTLAGHPIWVSKVAFGPHGLLASISYGGQVKLWDAKSGRVLGTLQGYSCVICAISFSPDGSLLVEGDDQGMLRVWDVKRGDCLKAFQGHAGRIWSVTFSPDGKTFATGGDDKFVKLWSIENEENQESDYCLMTFEGHTTMVWATAISPDGRMLASGGFERTVKLWKVNVQASLTILQGHDNFVWSVAFSPDGKMLASGNNDGEIRLWAVESGRCLRVLQNGNRPIGAVAFCSNGETLLSGSDDETVTRWNLTGDDDVREQDSKQGTKIIQSEGCANWAKAISFSSDGTMVAIGSDNHTVNVWNLEGDSDAQRLRVFSRNEGQVWSVAFSPDKRLLASGDDTGTLTLWNMETGACHRTLRSERPYERMNIRGVKGISEAQKASLKALGAMEGSG